MELSIIKDSRVERFKDIIRNSRGWELVNVDYLREHNKLPKDVKVAGLRNFGEYDEDVGRFVYPIIFMEIDKNNESYIYGMKYMLDGHLVEDSEYDVQLDLSSDTVRIVTINGVIKDIGGVYEYSNNV